jgi:hypothetical protein
MGKQKGGLNVNANNASIPLQTTAAAIGAIGSTATALGQATVLDPLSQSLHYLSTNPWLAGIAYVTLNLGGKHIAMNLTPEQEKMMSSPYIRPVIIFCLCFIATRNIITAFWLTMLFILVFYVVLYEGSPLCLFRVVQTQEKPMTSPQLQQPTQANTASPSQINVIPLFMRGPIALPDTSIINEELNYVANLQKY